MTEKENLTPDPVESDATVEQSDIQAEMAQEPAAAQAESAKIAELQKNLDEAKSKYIYLLSDFENYKRHAAKERIELIQMAGRDILSALLPVLDDFDRAEKNGALSEGTALIQHKLMTTVKQKGLARLDLKIGDVFNADQQEAVAEIPTGSEDMKGKIVDILEPGYMLGEKLIRYAKVVVGM